MSVKKNYNQNLKCNIKYCLDEIDVFRRYSILLLYVK